MDDPEKTEILSTIDHNATPEADLSLSQSLHTIDEPEDHESAHEALSNGGQKRKKSEADESSSETVKKAKRAQALTGKSAANAAGFKSREALSEDLPPLHELPEIFAEIALKALNHGLSGALAYLKGRPLRVATMCSGTESPILALKMMAEALKAHQLTMRVSHAFSAEIEPYKQAYIERNFRPPILFRDIEELTRGEGSTAYGKVTRVPPKGDVHLLVAGFACVDFSKLNNMMKTKMGMVPLDSKGKSYKFPSRQSREAHPEVKLQLMGESFGTFFAILDYAEEYRPPLVILENVMSAPWDAVLGAFQEIGYAAAVHRFDTKEYAIPHTRNRRYMLAIDKKSPMGEFDAVSAVSEWGNVMKKLRRPASSSVEAFLLQHDDPRLAYALAEAAKIHAKFDARLESQGPREYNWTACRERYRKYREDRALGTQRPYTEWIKNGSSRMPDHANLEWGRRQVDRVKDTLDILLLQGYSRGYDISFKP